ncbi:HAD-IIA family hydrolase [Pseudogracilibacillus auburnensis]|uniref:Acid sugar phosphatase n=1 Tax=Pseudogracilibacillus auburnensis TaxID=1494959 RepID=A0A2V3W0P6_9BACI|nr:HAD-IIA family hydrolase [Pseudogracilibacillus auburnensis]PXW82329.1 NagD protein [Pseudogracilibacillus auburnensis]
MATAIPKAFIFDLDGTIYLGDHLIEGAKESLQWVRKNNAKVRFVTNNPRYSREFYRKKLQRLGIETSFDEIITSAQITAKYLDENHQYGKIFVIGEEQLMAELNEKQINIVEDDTADTVLVSFDTDLYYEKLMTAYRALNKGANFITTNPDTVCPTPDGGLIDSGAIIAALEISTSRKLEKIIGKPSKILGDLLIQDLKENVEDCVVVGDRLNTDVRLGKQSNMIAVWIRAYNEIIPENTEYRPDYTIKSIAELPSLFD